MWIPIQYEDDQLPQTLCTLRRRLYCPARTRIPFSRYPNPYEVSLYQICCSCCGL